MCWCKHNITEIYISIQFGNWRPRYLKIRSGSGQISELLPGSGPDPGFGYPDPDDPDLRVKFRVGSRLSVTIPDPLFSLNPYPSKPLPLMRGKGLTGVWRVRVIRGVHILK